MGGAAGHLPHFYENPDITIDEVKELLKNASMGKIEKVTEKLDGKNIIFTWNKRLNELRVARNDGDLKSGGMGEEEVKEKFAGRNESLRESFTKGFEVLRDAVAALSDEEQVEVFGESGNRWFSAEIFYSPSPNIVEYDTNFIAFHMTPVIEVEGGNISRMPLHPATEILAKNVQRMQKNVKLSDWEVHGPSFVKIKALTDGTVLNNSLGVIDKEMARLGLPSSATIGEVTRTSVRQKLEEMGLEGSALGDTLSRVMKDPGAPDLRTLKKKYQFLGTKIEGAVRAEDRLKKEAVRFLDKAIGDFAMKFLETIESGYISDNATSVEEIRSLTRSAINKIRQKGDPGELAFLEAQLKRLGDEEEKSVKSAVEGIAFVYKGKVYKFTGAFAAANQIIGKTRDWA